MTHEIALELPWNETVRRVVEIMNSAGMQVVRSFNLRSARALIPDCACPHHNTTECDCQYIVLLVYGIDMIPMTLVVHGYDGLSWVLLADNAHQADNHQSKSTMIQLLSPVNVN